MSKRAWMVRAGEGGWFSETNLREKVASLGWLEKDDLSNIIEKEELRPLLIKWWKSKWPYEEKPTNNRVQIGWGRYGDLLKRLGKVMYWYLPTKKIKRFILGTQKASISTMILKRCMLISKKLRDGLLLIGQISQMVPEGLSVPHLLFMS